MDKDKPDLSRLTIAGKKEASVSKGNLKNSRGWLAAALLACVLVLVLLRSCLSGGGSPATPDKKQTTTSSLPAAASPASLTATGYVVAQRSAAVASKATGRLKILNVVEGDKVKKGQVLAELENDDLTALVNEREAFVRTQIARIESVQAELTNATLEKDRAESLRKEKVISQSELDRALARYRRAAADLESEKASLGLAQSQLEKARIDLDYTRIVAPFDGTVLTKSADVGEVVAPFGSSTDARAAVVTIADMDSLEVEADVSEANISKVSPGQECEISLDAIPGRTYKGKVAKIVPTVDRAKATVMTKIKFLDRDERVLPQMSARVNFRPPF